MKEAATRALDAIRKGRSAEFPNPVPGSSVQPGMDFRISSPCPKRWTDLVGDDRVRYCGDCKLNVYNLSAMTPAEIAALVRGTSGRLCGQIYVRGDRKATLQDCPSGGVGALRRKIRKVASAVLVLALGLAFRGMDRPDTSNLPPWLRAAANGIEPEKPPPPPRPRMMLGEICPATPPPPGPTGTAPRAGP